MIRGMIQNVAAEMSRVLAAGEVSTIKTGALAVTGRTTSAGFTSSINGTPALPAYNWDVAGDTDNGLYRDSENNWRMIAAGGAVHAFSASASSALGAFTASNGATITGGRTTSEGFSSSIPGTAALAAYNWTARVGQGLFDETTRLAIAFGGADKQYWSASLNHNYQAVSITGSLTGVSDITMAGHLTLSSGYIELTEIAAPVAPAANKVRLYAVDVAAKTRLEDRFPTGAAIAINTEV